MTNIFVRIKNKVLRIIHGPKRYKHLFRAIREVQARKILEIGTWNGRRAIQMIKLAESFHPADQIEYYGFDLFEQMTDQINVDELSKKPPTKAEVEKMLQATGAKIKLFQGFTQNTMPNAVSSLPKMDFIFIDGGHSVETIANDWKYAEMLMGEKTVVIFDDYYFDKDDVGAKKIIESIDDNRFTIKILSPRDSFKKDWGVLNINFVEVRRK